MSKFVNYWPTFFIFLLTSANTAFADSNNFLTGIAHNQVSADLSPYMAGMAATEVGPRNYRVSGTLGFALNPCNRIKATGEWLWQDIDYSFITGTSREWVQQSALGLGYQLVFNNPYINYFDISAYYSYAPSKNLMAVDFLDKTSGNILPDLRRIAGSRAGGLNPGLHFTPWQGADGSIELNWDDVAYDNINTSQATAKGFGGTAGLMQAVQIYQQNFKLGGSAAIRAPFDNYRAEVDWINPLPTSELLIGLFGDYTKGKQSMPNTSLVGINLSYAIDTPTPHLGNTTTRAVKPDSLLAWTSVPAVYMPQVLAITDEGVTTCVEGSQPNFTGSITTVTLADLPLNLSGRFTGNGPLTYSLTQTSGNATINPSTGVVTATIPSTNIIVTARGPCGAPAMTNSFNITA